MSLSADVGVSVPHVIKGDVHTEAGLEYRETTRAPPARRQSVAAEEHMLRLCRAALARVIDIVERGRIRCAAGGEGELRGN